MQVMRKYQKIKYIVIFSPHLSSKEDGKNCGELCKYELVKHKPCVGDIENVYYKCTEDCNLIKLWKDYQAELVAKDIPVPNTVNKLFQREKIKCLWILYQVQAIRMAEERIRILTRIWIMF